MSTSRRFSAVVPVVVALAGALGFWGPGTGAQEATPQPSPQASQAPVTADLTQVSELVRAKQYAEAERLAGELQQQHPDDPRLLALRGELLLALGRAKDAVEPLKRAAALAPDRPRVNFQLGSALAASGDDQAALDAFATEIRINQENEVLVLAHLNRALLLERRGDKPAAAAELAAVLEIDPARGPVYGDLSSLYLDLDRPDDATAVLARGAEAGFRSAGHWLAVGAHLVKAEAYERALDPLQRAIEIDPSLADAERTLAAVLDRLGRGPEAAQHFQRYLELAPGAADAASVRERLDALEKGK